MLSSIVDGSRVKDWHDDFSDEIGEFLADDADVASRRGSTDCRSALTSRARLAAKSTSDLFALLSIPWTDHETQEFLRLVGLDDGQKS